MRRWYRWGPAVGVVVAATVSAWRIARPPASEPPDEPEIAVGAELPPPPVAAPRPILDSLPSKRPTTSALYDAWAKAVRLHEAGKSKEALACLAALRKAAPAFFRDAERAALLADMERAAKRKPAPAAVPVAAGPPTLSAEARQTLARRLAASAPIVARATSPADRDRLNRFLARFVAPPGLLGVAGGAPGAANPGPWQDALLAQVAKDGAQRPAKGGSLAVADVDEAEQRRLEELEKLRQRDAVALLEPIAAGLAWLAIHQADDGRISDPTALARCKTLHGKAPCPLPAGAENEVATTALCALAFLDFRDQDARGLFEPALARAVRRLVASQRADGSFPGRRQYSTAIALMALGQAAASSGAEDVRAAVRRGLAYLASHQGVDGGWRYGLAVEVGDLSATGWVAQAFEAARPVVEPPASTMLGLDRFLQDVWLGGHRFAYLARGAERPPLAPVGMLVAQIAGDDGVEAAAPDWTAFLQGMHPAFRPDLYSLYYGVRMTIRLTGGLSGPWRKWVMDLAAEQEAKGPAAGCWRKSPGGFRTAGTVGVTAATLLTLEHALYLR